MNLSVSLLTALSLASAALVCRAAADGDWVDGRATFFDGNNQVTAMGECCTPPRQRSGTGRGAAGWCAFERSQLTAWSGRAQHAVCAPCNAARGSTRCVVACTRPQPQGSCMLGAATPDSYAAWPDTMAGYQGSCGTCLEVACANKDFTDAYGNRLQRSSACASARSMLRRGAHCGAQDYGHVSMCLSTHSAAGGMGAAAAPITAAVHAHARRGES